MGKKKTLIFTFSIVLLIAVFAGIAIGITSTTSAQTGGKKEGNSSITGGREAAEALIDKTVSRDEIKEDVGEWDEFEMNGNGCERGVYAGRFYYDGFIIYSRTYDKGETFRVMSIN